MQEAIAAANSGDTIQLAAGTYQGSGFREQIINAKDLTIIGAGIDQTLIDLENEGRAFIISNCDVSVSSLSIINGNGSVIGVFNVGTAGGAIASDKATLTITDVIFENCNTPGFTYSAPAGALLTRDTDLIMTDVQFLRCTAGIAGAWYPIGNTIATVTSVKFIECATGEGGWGGAVVPEGTSVLLFDNCEFSNNYGGFGGAIDDGAFTNYTMRNTLFQGNHGLYGGSVYTFGNSYSIYDNCTFRDNYVTNSGGAVRTTSESRMNLINCLFVNNTGNSGGAITAISSNPIIIENCIFRDNFGQQQGGAISQQGPTIIRNSLIENCRSNFISGGFDVIGVAELIFENVTLRGNTAFKGAAMSIETSPDIQFNIVNSVFEDNIATSAAGAVVISSQSVVTFTNSIFRRNSATTGGSFQAASSSNVTLDNCLFYDNNAASGGALVSTDSATIYSKNSQFYQNSAILSGGAIYQDAYGTIFMTDSQITNNNARNGGGYAVSDSATECLHLTRVIFEGNSAVLGGGAIYFVGVPSGCDYENYCDNCGFNNNTALFGNSVASSAYQLGFKNSPPTTLSASTQFTVELNLLDRFGEVVLQQRSLLIQATVSTENVTLTGITEQESSSDGIAEFKLLKLFAAPETSITLQFNTNPATVLPLKTDIFVTNCQNGAEARIIDGRYHCLQVNDITYPLKVAIFVITSVCIALSVMLFILLIVYRNHSVIKKSSPVLCCMIVGGAIISYISVYFWLDTTDPFCVLRVWLLMIGFTVMYSSFFAKEWRLWKIFNPKALKSISRITDKTLIKIVLVVLAIECVIVLFWFIFFPYLQRITTDFESIEESITFECYSETPAFLYTMLALNCALLLFGCFLAIATRRLPSAYNESQHLAFSIYNATLTLFVVVPVASVLTDPTEISITVTSGILFSTTMSLLVLFIPKLHLTLRKGAIVRALRKSIQKLETDLLWRRRQLSEFESVSDSNMTMHPPTRGNAVAASMEKGSNSTDKTMSDKN
jgi:predicted outer membrane repeat protein